MGVDDALAAGGAGGRVAEAVALGQSSAVSIRWRGTEKKRVEAALRRYPAESGMCAPLARLVFDVARQDDATATGVQIRPRGSARYILTKYPTKHVWHSHTLVRTRAHHIDALTGADGCAQGDYLAVHWEHPEALEALEVDVADVDPGVQHADE